MPVKKTQSKTTSLDDLVRDIRKTHGDRSIAALGDDVFYDIEKIPTGVLALDSVLGGGLARGKMVEFSGWEGCLAESTFINYNVVNLSTDQIHNQKGGTIKRLYERFNQADAPANGSPKTDAYYTVPSMDDDGRIFHNRVTDVIYSGIKECFELTTEDGFKIRATADHPFFNGEAYQELSSLSVGDTVVVHNNTPFREDNPKQAIKPFEYFVKHHPFATTKVVNGCIYHRINAHRFIYEAHMNNLSIDEYRTRLNDGNLDGLEFIPEGTHIHHIDENRLNNEISNLVMIPAAEHNRQHALEGQSKLRFVATEDIVTSIISVGEMPTYDIKVEDPYRNYVANKFVVHNCGKTSIALKAIAEAQKLGKVVFIDAENAFDPALAEKSGVDTDSLYVSQPDTAENSFEIIEDILPADDLAMIVVDSVEGLVPRAEIEGDYGDAFVGVKARLMSAALRKLSRSMVQNESQAVIIWINQLREKIGGMGYGPQNTTPGGKALKFWSSTRIEVARTGQVKQGEDVVGHTVKAKVVKNRFAPPFQVAQFDIIYGSGISNEGTILDLALSRGLVTKSGAWFADAETGENLGQGRMAVLARLGSDVDLSERLTQAVMKL